MNRFRTSISVHSKTFLAFPLLFCLFGCIALIAGIFFLKDGHTYDRYGIYAVGTVTSHTTSRGSKGSVHHHAKTYITLPSLGVAFTVTFPRNIDVGGTIPVKAMKQKNGTWNAKEASFDGLYLDGLIFMLLGVLFSSIGLFFGLWHLKRTKEINHLRQFGKKTSATITGINEHRSKRRSYFTVSARPNEILKGATKELTFISEPIRQRLHDQVIGTHVTVLVDRNDPSIYLFEIESL